MKAVADRSTSKSSGTKKVSAPGLRTGKIHRAQKTSAAQILRNVGVTAADQRLADKALKIAAAQPKVRAATDAPKNGTKVVAAKQARPAAAKKR